MADLRPFRAIRPRPDLAPRVASVPYDVVSTSEARALAEGNDDSFLHVVRAEIALPEGSDGEAIHARAKANLDALLARGAMEQDGEPCMYVYRLTWLGQSQTGVVAAHSVEEYDTGRIVKHEHTRPDKEMDRTRHVEVLHAQTGPVFLAYRRHEAVDAAVATIVAGEPFAAFTASDDVTHEIWRVTDSEALQQAFGQVDPIYVADGHHRSASASNVRARRREAGSYTSGDASDHFLAVSFPDEELRILPYNRVVQDFGDRTAEQFLETLGALMPVREVEDGEPAKQGEARFYMGGVWRAIDLEPLGEDPVSKLDAQILQRRILEPLLGIDDPRTNARIGFVGGIRGTGELKARVDGGEAAIAFSLPAVTAAELFAVSDAGLTMPPKSTWFEPKLRSGLFVYPLEPRS